MNHFIQGVHNISGYSQSDYSANYGNASARAMKALDDGGILASDELHAARATLSAAAMTYVAALATSLASLLRLILIFNRRR